MKAFVPDYDLQRESSLAATLERLRAEPGVWLPFAGGTDLMVQFESGRLKHKRFLDIARFPELQGIRVGSEWVEIGAATTYARIAETPELRAEFAPLVASAEWTGARAIQSRGTIGGNLANASPAADTAPVLLSYDAEIELRSATGARWLPLADFYRAYKTTALEPGELITMVRFRRSVGGWLQRSRKVGTRNAQAISKVFVAVAARVAREGDGDRLAELRVGLGSLGPFPMRARATEAALVGRRLDATLAADAARALAAELKPIDDVRSTAAFRRVVAANLLEDFIASLLNPKP